MKTHPFPIEAHFDFSLVLTFSFSVAELEPLVPEPLKLDTLDEKHAFVAVAMVKTKGLRPRGFPKIFGRDFFLIGYRIFVRYRSGSGRNLRGLYILRSETAQPGMTFLGNLMTHYSYRTIDVASERAEDGIRVRSIQSDLDVRASGWGSREVELPETSVFRDWKTARRFAGPLPFTFSVLPGDRVLMVEGVREKWSPRPIQVEQSEIGFLRELGLCNGALASAFLVEDIPYWWKKGRVEKWR